ncbi:hypothetical protein XELAEV_18035968mg [Xenopus laevis]|uniref:Uncharacterized protein n=1 Tax=Xenopus laevis TaxID=8355 RepID=A0A974CH00_XENLA|nr:hypothetical protein XELAEV_18035968mg [Xenopus laevis]
MYHVRRMVILFSTNFGLIIGGITCYLMDSKHQEVAYLIKLHESPPSCWASVTWQRLGTLKTCIASSLLTSFKQTPLPK